MRHLLIDRILNKKGLIDTGQRLSTILKEKISSRATLSPIENEKIDRFTDDIKNDNIYRLVSVGTPMEDFTPVTFDLIFDMQDLSITEETNLSLEHILWLRNNYLIQLPKGHHCEIFVRCHSGIPELFKLLPIDSYDRIKIGLCNKEDWNEVRNSLIESKREFESWNLHNNLPKDKSQYTS
ncbi:hypothetical protein ACFQ21_22785 [Ohtaekwangia kribbensis]|uniref:Uncharacterized protein n=1 Tax=Ohtaekwangia kribbensis TaxID=688913 RepID=A0ABW3K7D9_9BACT